MYEEGGTRPRRRSKWEIMLSAKPCAVCGANARYLNSHPLWVCPRHRFARYPSKRSPEGGPQ